MKTKTKQDRDEKIINILNDNPGGLTILDMSKLLKVTTVSTAKYLDILVAQNKIYVRTISTAKIHYHLNWAKKFNYIK